MHRDYSEGWDFSVAESLRRHRRAVLQVTLLLSLTLTLTLTLTPTLTLTLALALALTLPCDRVPSWSSLVVS